MSIEQKIARAIPQLQLGKVWCRGYGKTQHINNARVLREGWPKCCGYTMTIYSPGEQRSLSAPEAKP